MRLQVLAVALGVAGALGGGALVSRWCLGLVLIALSAAGIVWGGFVYDDGQDAAPGAYEVGRTQADVLEMARRS